MKKRIFSTLLFIIIVGCNEYQKRDITKYKIDAFFDNIAISGGYFSSSEDKLIFSSNESGIYNVYEVNIDNGAISQLTNSKKESFF